MLKKRASGKLRKNKANSWMKKNGIGKNLLEKRKGGLETYEVREGHRGKKTAGRKKRKV
ncbi:hypothetical protein [Prevotella denticola]|uniref:hypothetical protein n=1 Tax=Prevotella denticola TaxID=28129 RepID=UPI0014786D46|nr:hypothetical protein [Prevotella denticola]